MVKSFNHKLNLITIVSFRIADILEKQDFIMPDIDYDFIYGYVDGLCQKRILKIINGKCSLQASIDFDMALEEKRVYNDFKAMRRIYEKLAQLN